jgi:general secretion pathway protein J
VRSRAGEAGFTLIELLIALTLTALLATLIFGTLRVAAQAWSKSDDRASDAAELWAVEHVLRDALDAAYPAYASADPNDRTIAFDGGAASLALVAPLPQAIGAGILARLRFFLAGEGRSRILVIGWRLDLPAADPGTSLPENRLMLLDHVRSLRFAYFGAGPGGGVPAWQEGWSGRDRLPDLVRVRIERDGASFPDWPAMTAEPRTAMNSACQYDPATLDCRRVP